MVKYCACFLKLLSFPFLTGSITFTAILAPIKKSRTKTAVGNHLAEVVDREPELMQMIKNCKEPLIGVCLRCIFGIAYSFTTTIATRFLFRCAFATYILVSTRV